MDFLIRFSRYFLKCFCLVKAIGVTEVNWWKISRTLMILWGMLNFNTHDRSQATIRRTLVGVRAPFHRPLSHITGLKCLRDEYEGCHSDRHIARSCTPRCPCPTWQDEIDVSNNVPEVKTPGTNIQEQSKKGHGMQWVSPLTPNQAWTWGRNCRTERAGSHWTT